MNLALVLLLMFGTQHATVIWNVRTHRSPSARHQFEHTHPCPSTGKRYGACPGYVIDHVVALACGGPDRPSNMQWQTIAAGKAKDKWERRNCSKGHKQ